MTPQSKRQVRQRIGVTAALSIQWEVAAPKAGNVHRGADFEDASFLDFMAAATIVAPLLAETADTGVGATVRKAAEATLEAVGTNTNLGTLLLLAPLAAAAEAGWPARGQLESCTVDVLDRLTPADTADIYAAIQLVQPGGLGSAMEADVNDSPPPLTPVEAMRLASSRDVVARQYTNGFEDVFHRVAPLLQQGLSDGLSLATAIVSAQLRLLAAQPDSLIMRKCGEQVAAAISARAAKVVDAGQPDDEAFQREFADFDFWLRCDGTRRNPGSTADLIAAGLFVLLWRNEVDWPLDFYGRRANQVSRIR